MKMSTKLLLSFGLVLAIILMVIGFTYKNFIDQNEAIQWNNHTYKVIIEAADIESSFINMETGVRGFALTGDNSYLEPYYMGLSEFENHFSMIKTLTEDNQVQQERLDQIKVQKEQWLALEAEPLIQIRENRSSDYNLVTRFVQEGNGKTAMDGIRHLLSEVIAEEEALLEQRSGLLEELIVFTRTIIFVGSTLAVLLTLVIIFVLNRTVAQSTRRILNGLTAVANGDLTNEVKVVGKDEMAQMSIKLNEMIVHLRELLTSVNHSSQAVLDASNSLSEISNQTAKANDEVATTVMEIATGAGEQAVNIEEGAAQINDLGLRIKNVSLTSTEMKEASAKTHSLSDKGVDAVQTLTEKAEESYQVSQKANEAIIKVNESTDQIGTIINSISDIAGQTNLLALNASIEAARAGEAGKGFSVVADEIRKLAEQSSNSVKEIQDILNQIQNNADVAFSSMTGANEIVQQQNAAVEQTRIIFEDISVSIVQLIEKVSEVTTNSKDMDAKKDSIISMIEKLSALSEETAASTEQVSAATEEQSASMHELSHHASSLHDLSNDLLEKVKRFKLK